VYHYSNAARISRTTGAFHIPSEHFTRHPPYFTQPKAPSGRELSAQLTEGVAYRTIFYITTSLVGDGSSVPQPTPSPSSMRTIIDRRCISHSLGIFHTASAVYHPSQTDIIHNALPPAINLSISSRSYDVFLPESVICFPAEASLLRSCSPQPSL